MKMPPALSGTALLFWGWQTGYLFPGIFMAFVWEAARFIPLRLKLMPKDFYRIMDLCALILVGMTVVRYSAGTASLARWLPMAVFPILVAQAYSTVQGVDLGALFLIVRKREKRAPHLPRRTVDLSYHGFLLVLIATSAANVRTPVFYVGMAFLTVWALWPLRPKNYAVPVWGILAVAAMGIGWYGQMGLQHLQKIVEGAAINLLLNQNGETDPLQVTTAIGDIGELKLQDHIVMRVIPETHFRSNELFRSGTYSSYRAGRWFAMNSSFSPVPEDENECRQLGPERIFAYQASVFRKLNHEKGLLALPAGVSKIENLSGMEVSRNRLGVIRFEGPLKTLFYRTSWDGRTSHGDAPDATDFKIPRELRPVVASIANELGFTGMSPTQVLKALQTYFQGFQYSLVQKPAGANVAPLETFLRNTQAGHCEHFATATALLLRAAGIPTRYAVGYLVAEYSRLGNCFVVRQNHAHAWTLAYIDGAWQSVDNTPSIWVAQETPDASFLKQLMDVAGYVKYRFDRWRHENRMTGLKIWGFLVIMVLIVIVIRRLKRLRGMVQKKADAVPLVKTPRPDRPLSPFNRLEKHVREAFGVDRHPWEPYGTWLRRLEKSGVPADSVKPLKSMLRLHNRLCFSPSGLTLEEKETLSTGVDAWIAGGFGKSGLFNGR